MMRNCWVTLAVLVCSLMLMSCDSTQSERSDLASAKKYFSEGDYASSTIELKGVLQSNPNNTEARLLLGTIYFAEEDMPSAEIEIEKYIELGGDVDVALPLLSKILVEQDKIRSLRDLEVKNLSDDAKALVFASQTLGLVSGREPVFAEEKLRQAEDLNSADAYVKFARAKFDLSQADVDIGEVHSFVASIVNESPTYAPAWKLLGDIEQMSGDLEAAESNYTRAIENSVRNLRAHYSRAVARFRMDEVDRAFEDVKVIEGYAPKSVMYHYLNGLYWFSKGDYKVAVESLSVANETGFFPITDYYLAMIHLAEGNDVLAESFAKNYFELATEDLRGRKLLATVYLKVGKPQDVLKLLSSIDEDPEVLSLMSRAHLQLNQVEESVALLTQVSELKPESPKVQMDLGNSYLMLGNKELGLQHLQAAIDLDNSLDEADVSMVVGLVKVGEHQKAIEAAQAYLAKNPDNYIAHNLMGLSRWKAGDTARARQSYQKSIALNPDDSAAHKALATMAMEADDVEQAKTHYQSMLDINDNDYLVMMKLAFIYGAQKNDPKMVEYLQMAIDAVPNEIQPRVVLARYYLSKGEPLKVDVVLSALPHEKKSDPSVLNVSARSHLATQNYQTAARKLEKLVRIQPDSYSSHFLLAKAYSGLGRKNDVEAELLQVIQLKPDHWTARVGLARLYFEAGQLERSAEQIQQVESFSPNNVDALKVKYAISKAKGSAEDSVKILKHIYSLEETEKNLIELALAEKMSGNRKEAESLLNAWIERHKNSVEARLELANLMLEDGKKQEAIGHYKSTLMIDDKNYQVLNNIAWNLLESNPSESLSYAKRAINTNPDSPVVLDTLALAYLENGQQDLAKSTVNKALLRSPNNPEIIYHSAKIDLVSGDVFSAKKTLVDLLDKYPSFSMRDEASALLNEVNSKIK
ncbi:PEP-CTERM system TPR-repeat protein PrsT [Aestuariicella hydrocarbonica]|uniref:PEP-CTERM system TPR-repeat protein PrsT n=1 Tax=Pseudomaricurvus hydrocarbonicus TaxID=1470433 RepID=A0A9E5JSX0_9GAMM|nr:XrtA/PEP-CTERM system TPR-repeat protein PrsT [Aestuariicella hydrocarbonica]NHO64714.1 PEP-CTERM system TPR-repeat protein PrsT [Aestuariicella hydrocarbonica]